MTRQQGSMVIRFLIKAQGAIQVASAFLQRRAGGSPLVMLGSLLAHLSAVVVFRGARDACGSSPVCGVFLGERGSWTRVDTCGHLWALDKL